MRVEKWHGAGNDFLVVDGRVLARAPDWPSWCRWACDRRRGVGADGLLVLEKDEELDFRMHYRNADGGEAEMCGNGGRVLAAFATTQGIGRGGRVRFRSGWGTHEAAVSRGAGPGVFDVELTLPDVVPPSDVKLDAPWGKAKGIHVSCGVPHLVLPLEETPSRTLEAAELATWGPVLRRHPSLGPEGANVDILARASDGVFALRTFERGVEAETLACGTGATAAASAVVHRGWGDSPVRVRVWSGDELVVTFERAGERLTGVTLRGPAVRVFATDVG